MLKRVFLGFLAGLLFSGNLNAAGTYSRIKTWNSGETLTASDLNAEFNNILTNSTPAGIDDYSASATEMRTTTDPYPASAESLATSLQGELERIRYVIAQLSGKTYWYQDPTITNLFNYRRPNLVYVSATTVDIETNTATTNMTTVMFPDGDVRSVTEDVSSTSKYRRFIITETYNSTSTENSGLRTNYVETANTWYALYAVKSTTDTSKFVIVGDTVTPVQANISALNSQYGSNSWVYLGAIRNGNGTAGNSDILSFVQSGKKFKFNNTLAAADTAVNAVATTGLVLANTASATTLTWAYDDGTGSAEVPGNIGFIDWITLRTAHASYDLVSNSAASRFYERRVCSNNNGDIVSVTIPASEGIKLATGAGASEAFDVIMVGWEDSALGVGTNPLF